MRQRQDKTSRILGLVISLSLIGGIGCFADRGMSPEQQIAAQQAAAERNRQAVETLQRSADSGDTLAITRLGINYVTGNLGLIRDVPKGVHLLERAAAKQYAPAEYTLGWLYLEGKTSNVAIPLSPAMMPREPGRGIELLKQSASHACTPAPIAPYSQTANLINSLYRQGRLIETDMKQADLWLARSIVYCQVPNAQIIANIFLNPNLMTPQSQIDAMALLLMMPPSDVATKLQSTLSPEGLQAATRKMEAMRQALADSTNQYPAPPHPGKP
jgi:hypothetical protein